jgi:lipopolysaccharide export system permease protein
MLYVLQKYILKELLRAFAMTAVALTCMLGFGGGLMDMLRSQGITAHEMIRLMVYLIPVVLAYSLPVAALFATTITYGRLSADNEINACRASGVNIYRLLFPAVILSILVSLVTFTLENYTIPRLASKIEQLVKRDIQSLAYMELKNRGFINRMNYALHCGRVESLALPELQPDGSWTPGQIELTQVAFLRHERDIPIFYGTAKTALILFDNNNNAPSVSIHLNQVRAFNEERGEMIQAAYYPIGPVPIPTMASTKIKFLSLPTLVSILRDPFEFSRMKEAQKSLYAILRNSMAYEYIFNELKKNGQFEFKSDKEHGTITADSCRQLSKDGRVILEGKVVLQLHPNHGSSAKFEASDAVITASSLSDDLPPTLNIELKKVKVTESRGTDSSRFASHDRFSVGPLSVPASILEAASEKKVKVETLISPESDYNFPDNLNQKRTFLHREKDGTLAKCLAEIHSRLSYSFSALVLLLLGAGLGIIFRGGHFVSAFGLSFIPMMVVVVMIMTGKQLSTSGFVQMGIVVIWLGIAVVALADFLVLGKFLRR